MDNFFTYIENHFWAVLFTAMVLLAVVLTLRFKMEEHPKKHNSKLSQNALEYYYLNKKWLITLGVCIGAMLGILFSYVMGIITGLIS
ncbi:hypothetical protein [Leeuwenhoekiella sp. CH_XMU1409-2]|uniref:hypothetical protein n=1 Tax=Leeuwenhoekiella sp. CH_XMU1409-2 TaxID=3107768 RepID=UPI003009B17A